MIGQIMVEIGARPDEAHSTATLRPTSKSSAMTPHAKSPPATINRRAGRATGENKKQTTFTICWPLVLCGCFFVWLRIPIRFRPGSFSTTLRLSWKICGFTWSRAENCPAHSHQQYWIEVDVSLHISSSHHSILFVQLRDSRNGIDPEELSRGQLGVRTPPTLRSSDGARTRLLGEAARLWPLRRFGACIRHDA